MRIREGVGGRVEEGRDNKRDMRERVKSTTGACENEYLRREKRECEKELKQEREKAHVRKCKGVRKAKCLRKSKYEEEASACERVRAW